MDAKVECVSAVSGLNANTLACNTANSYNDSGTKYFLVNFKMISDTDPCSQIQFWLYDSKNRKIISEVVNYNAIKSHAKFLLIPENNDSIKIAVLLTSKNPKYGSSVFYGGLLQILSGKYLLGLIKPNSTFFEVNHSSEIEIEMLIQDPDILDDNNCLQFQKPYPVLGSNFVYISIDSINGKIEKYLPKKLQIYSISSKLNSVDINNTAPLFSAVIGMPNVATSSAQIEIDNEKCIVITIAEKFISVIRMDQRIDGTIEVPIYLISNIKESFEPKKKAKDYGFLSINASWFSLQFPPCNVQKFMDDPENPSKIRTVKMISDFDSIPYLPLMLSPRTFLGGCSITSQKAKEIPFIAKAVEQIVISSSFEVDSEMLLNFPSYLLMMKYFSQVPKLDNKDLEIIKRISSSSEENAKDIGIALSKYLNIISIEQFNKLINELGLASKLAIITNVSQSYDEKVPFLLQESFVKYTKSIASIVTKVCTSGYFSPEQLTPLARGLFRIPIINYQKIGEKLLVPFNSVFTKEHQMKLSMLEMYGALVWCKAAAKESNKSDICILNCISTILHCCLLHQNDVISKEIVFELLTLIDEFECSNKKTQLITKLLSTKLPIEKLISLVCNDVLRGNVKAEFVEFLHDKLDIVGEVLRDESFKISEQTLRQLIQNVDFHVLRVLLNSQKRK